MISFTFTRMLAAFDCCLAIRGARGPLLSPAAIGNEDAISKVERRLSVDIGSSAPANAASVFNSSRAVPLCCHAYCAAERDNRRVSEGRRNLEGTDSPYGGRRAGPIG